MPNRRFRLGIASCALFVATFLCWLGSASMLGCASAAPTEGQQAEALASEVDAAFPPEGVVERAMVATANLYTITLPAGSRGTLNVGWPFGLDTTENLDPQVWLSQGYDGVRFVGAGIGKTVIERTGWNGCANVGAHNGIVRFEGITFRAGYDRAVGVGQQNTAMRVYPKFAGQFSGCEFIADLPPPGVARTKWLLFSYQADLTVTDCVFRGRELREHDVYTHGASSRGWIFERCKFLGAGAEVIKFRPDTSETAFVPGLRLIVRGCVLEDWRQPWSDRGGAGIVAQNSTADILIENCIFRPRPGEGDPVSWNDRSHCIEIAAEDDGYSLTDGTGARFGNGIVLVRNCAMWGKSLVDWHNTVLRVADNGRGNKLAAKAAVVQSCGIWGSGVIVNISDVPTGKVLVSGCNTPAIAAFCKTLRFDVSSEAMWPGPNRKTPISLGASR